MELYDEEDLKNSRKGKKVIIAMLIISIMLLIFVLAVMFTMPQNTEIKQRLFVDGKEAVLPKDLFYSDNEGIQYVDINGFAKLVGFEYLRGEYKEQYTEDNNKCYVSNKEQATSFILDSNEIYKADPNAKQNNQNYEFYEIKKPVILLNNKLYASIDCISIAFNSQYEQSNDRKTIRIYTLPYLYSYYEKSLKEKYNYDLSVNEIVVTDRETKTVNKEQSFRNKKALAYGMAIINKENKFGVISTSGNIIIGTKYDNVDFIEEKQEFIVTSDKKLGLVSNTGETKINLEYDSLELLDKKDDYYLVSKNSKCGIINSEEEIVVPLQIDKIGYGFINNQKMYYLQIENNMITLEDYLNEL